MIIRILSGLLTICILVVIIGQYIINDKLQNTLKSMEQLTDYYKIEIPKIVKILDGKENVYSTFLNGIGRNKFGNKLHFSYFFKDKTKFDEHFSQIIQQAKKVTNHHYELAEHLTRIATELDFVSTREEEKRLGFFNLLLNLQTSESNDSYYTKQLKKLQGHASQVTETLIILVTSLAKIGEIIDVEITKKALLNTKERTLIDETVQNQLNALIDTKKSFQKVRVRFQEILKDSNVTSDEILAEVSRLTKELEVLQSRVKSNKTLNDTIAKQITLIKDYREQLIKVKVDLKKQIEQLILRDNKISKLSESLRRFTGDETVIEVVTKVLEVDNNQGFVLFNAGELEGMQKGMQMVITRGGEYLAQARIYKTTETHSFAKINLETVNSNSLPSEGDIAISLNIKVKNVIQ